MYTRNKDFIFNIIKMADCSIQINKEYIFNIEYKSAIWAIDFGSSLLSYIQYFLSIAKQSNQMLLHLVNAVEYEYGPTT